MRWPDFRPEAVLFEDEDLLVIDKPAGVPSQAAREDRPDDVVTRLKAYLGARDAIAADRVYLGVHQRLDRDTSGTLLFTKRVQANASIAKQFEKRSLKKRYLAGVEGWPKERRSVTLDDLLAKGDDGRMQVVTQRAKNGQRAITHVRVRARNAARTLLDIVLETGRTHQARVQLAHAGSPIAGDPLYRGPRAPRLMLHASAIELEHPSTGKRLVVESKVPAEMDAWLARGDLGTAVFDDDAALDRALALAMERRWGLAHDERTTAFRLVNEEGDALPGLAVDVYGDHLVAQLYVSEEWNDARRARVLDRLHALGFAGVYVKLRPKQANVLVDTRRDDLAPKTPVRGEAAPEEITVREEGVPFAVRLGDGLSTGIFLDQRANRLFVRESAKDQRVANLFSYTCAFSIVAALGGAKRTVSVDASIAALERGRHGFAVAGITLDTAHAFAAEDAFAWLARTKERFDLVILDPPSYSTTKKRRFVAESDYDELVELAAKIVTPGGRILASCNHRGLTRSKLRRLVGQGVRAAGREPLQIKDLPETSDFPPVPGRDPNMKSVLATLR
jgi:23S rRNA (cytosine1962-C5)-methyltransferase